MTLPATKPISISQVRIELGRAGTVNTSLAETATRTLFGVPSGAISLSNGLGKSNRVALSYVISTNTANVSLNITTLSGYISGKSDVTITINTGIWVYSTSTANAALTLTGGNTGDTVKVVNLGYIGGMGGKGGGWVNGSTGQAAGVGGPAISLGFNTTIDNTNSSAYIGGGGGGGGQCANGPSNDMMTGGGGAGGGYGGTMVNFSNVTYAGGAGG